MIGLLHRRNVGVGVAALVMLAGLPVFAAAQNAIVRGTVTSADRQQPLANINVVITSLNISVYTAENGNYTITVPAARIPAGPVNITARGIGFKALGASRTLQVGEIVVDFRLQTDINRLEEIIVTGVVEGVERQKVPFSVGRVTSEDMPVPAVDPLRALQGKAAGVRIANTTGFPGSTPEILLRGPTSIQGQGRGQGPLIVVDDAILNVGSLQELGGLDIESIEVVKGAAGASLYGARAANGVISIRTRRGATGADQVRFNVRTEYGVQDFPLEYRFPVNHHLQLDETGTRFCADMNPRCGRTFDWMKEILRINNVVADTARVPLATIYSSSGNSTDLRNVFQSNYWPGEYYYTPAAVLDVQPTVLTSIDATGKVGNVSFYVAGQYSDEPGAVRFLNGIQQRRGRVNLDYSARSDLRIAISSMFTNSTQDNRNFAWGAIMRGTPAGTNYLARDTLGRLLVRGGGGPLRGTGNGGAGIHYNGENFRADRLSTRFLSSVTGKYYPSDWFTLEGTFAYDVRKRSDENVVPKGFRTQPNLSTANNNGNMTINNRMDEAWNTSLTATFRHRFSDQLSSKVSVRGLYDETAIETDGHSGQVFLVQGIDQTSNLSTNFTTGSSSSETKTAALVIAGDVDYKDRYILQGSFRYDGSSRFGSGNRWAPFGRISGVWRVSEEPWFDMGWLSDFRLRASRGTAGSSPIFSAQYEVYNVSASGITLGQAGNSQLKPETTTEIEVGTDFELFNRIGVELTYAHGLTRDQILNVGTPASLGFSNQWQNAGTLENKTWELGVTVPIVNSRSLYWQMRGTWDRNRTFIKELFVPEFIFTGGTGQGTATFFRMREGERLGNIYGGKFAKTCAELPASFRSDCGGSSSSFQVNDEGWLVWVGAGNSWRDGVTKNLWGTILPVDQAPFNRPLSFGHPIMIANPDAPNTSEQFLLGNALPDYRFTFANDIQYKRLTLYTLLDATIGHTIHNQAEAWGLLDFNSSSFDQGGKTVETAKPVGYSWRCGPPCNASGTGGFYDGLGPNNYNTVDGSFAKLREVSLTYKLGAVGGLGDWTVGLIGRNLLTFTGYTGYDPETGVNGGGTGSGLINQVDAFDFPVLRSFTFSVSTRF